MGSGEEGLLEISALDVSIHQGVDWARTCLSSFRLLVFPSPPLAVRTRCLRTRSFRHPPTPPDPSSLPTPQVAPLTPRFTPLATAYAWWQMLAERTGAVLKYAQIKDDMSLDVEHMKTLITPKTKLVTMVRERTSERERDNPNPNRVRLRGSVTSLRVFFSRKPCLCT